MGKEYRCENERRRAAVRDTRKNGKPILNGIDYLEVLDQEAPNGSPRQRTLVVRCFADVPSDLTGSRVKIEGGVRVTAVKVLWAYRVLDIPDAALTLGEKAFFASLSEPEKVLAVRTDSSGDYSTYRLLLTRSDTDAPPFDPQLSEIVFSFKVECPSEFDCRPSKIYPWERLSEPVIDYLAKDYASFRHLMLDRLAVIMPDWQERNPADVGIALVEGMAYVADQLSYYQDAVATEAYLGTARKRTSVRRHARLLDYPMHDGCNARAWVTFEVGPAADGLTLPGPTSGKPGMTLLTQTDAPRGGLNIDETGLEAALSSGALVFETLHEITLHAAHNEIYFHTWGDDRCCLPQGATRATLRQKARDGDIKLQKGDVLIFEEVLGRESGKAADADLTHRHAVRLTEVQYTEDPLNPTQDLSNPGPPIPVAEISWAADDALPFPLCLWEIPDENQAEVTHPVAVARGNVVLADHGRTVSEKNELSDSEKRKLSEIGPGRSFRPKLEFGPITQQGRAHLPMGEQIINQDHQPALFGPQGPASAAFSWEMGDVLPAVRLDDSANGVTWLPQRDLLSSDRFAWEFVVETEDDGATTLRFGDGVMGSQPISGLKATYRIGNGRTGNVGAEAIAHVIAAQTGILGVRNPLPAAGGADPEPIEHVRLYAPQAFRIQERAVTEADYGAVAARHPEVQKAVATRRWTGSWYTMFITVDRKGGLPVDGPFKEELCRFINRFRLAGYDLEIDTPHFVALDIVFTVCVAPGHLRSDVKLALLESFSNQDLPGGRRGFFHPDAFTFGQPVYLSQLVAAAMQVTGVKWIDTDDTPPKLNRFRRWGQPSHGELADGSILMARLEIARLDNDPNRPENGKIDFLMEGYL